MWVFVTSSLYIALYDFVSLFSTGIGTSSVYCDGNLRKKGFPYECVKEVMRRQTIVVKSHGVRDVSKFEKIIFIVRNPFDALLAYARYHTAGHTGNPPAKTLIAGKCPTSGMESKSVI